MFCHTVNGNKFTQACALLDQAQELYAEGEYSAAYVLALRMFPCYNKEAQTAVLSGTRKVHRFPEANRFQVFFSDEEVTHDQ